LSGHGVSIADIVAKFDSVDAYVASFPAEARKKLEAVRAAIAESAPGTVQTIKYDIPTFTVDGRYVVYFAGWQRHISIYPIPAADQAFERELAPYVAGRGTLRFPLDEPLPLKLIRKVVTALMSQRRDPSG
jgi:uncharacterized protein YdhG (YjbR/CyaY superfamily)